MNKFLHWIAWLLQDNRGEVGVDDSADATLDENKKEDQAEFDDDFKDLDDELTIDLDENKDEEDEEAKKKADEAKAKEAEEKFKTLLSENETLKEKEKEWKRREYQGRKDREGKKELETGKDEKPLNDAQLEQLLEDADVDGDKRVKLNVLKYLTQLAAKGEATKIVNTAEMGRKAEDFKKNLETKFPSIADPGSDMRADIDRTKDTLGIADHPYGDMFAVGFRLLEDMDDLLEAAREAGKEEALKGAADKNRKKEIKDKLLPSSKRSVYKKTHGLSVSQLETAQLMNLSPDQLPAYAKLVGKKPRSVSVEG
jgi:hypothetical protein